MDLPGEQPSEKDGSIVGRDGHKGVREDSMQDVRYGFPKIEFGGNSPQCIKRSTSKNIAAMR